MRNIYDELSGYSVEYLNHIAHMYGTRDLYELQRTIEEIEQDIRNDDFYIEAPPDEDLSGDLIDLAEKFMEGM